MNFTQDINIDNLIYTCSIINNENDNYKLLFSKNNVKYSCVIYNDDVDTLKYALNELEGLKCLYNFNNNELLKINIIHKSIKLNISHELFIEKNLSFNDIIEDRVKKLEDNKNKIYPIKNTYLGPCVIVDDENYMKPDYVYYKLRDIINSKDYRNNGCFLMELIIYYDIKYIYQDVKPLISKNQLIFDGIHKFNCDKYYKPHISDNFYTILTKKYDI